MANSKLPRIQNRADVDSLSVYRKALLPNGVRAEKCCTSDTFHGRRNELIAAGCALPDWFPDTPVAGERPGTTKSRFYYPDPAGCGDVLLARSGPDIWRVELPVAKEVEQRRCAELAERQARWKTNAADLLKKEDGNRHFQESEFQQRLSACLKRLPVFVPGSMSEGEIHAMRVMRALDDRHWNDIISIAERFLASEQRDENMKNPTAPRLRLIVNNEVV